MIYFHLRHIRQIKNLKSPANKLKKQGVTIFTMGVTRHIRYRELRLISSGSSYVLHVHSYFALYQVTRLLEEDKDILWFFGF